MRALTMLMLVFVNCAAFADLRNGLHGSFWFSGVGMGPRLCNQTYIEDTRRTDLKFGRVIEECPGISGYHIVVVTRAQSSEISRYLNRREEMTAGLTRGGNRGLQTLDVLQYRIVGKRFEWALDLKDWLPQNEGASYRLTGLQWLGATDPKRMRFIARAIEFRIEGQIAADSRYKGRIAVRLGATQAQTCVAAGFKDPLEFNSKDYKLNTYRFSRVYENITSNRFSCGRVDRKRIQSFLKSIED